MPPLDIPALQQVVAQNRYLITAHAKERMGQRQVTDHDIKHVIAVGDVTEQFPHADPYPKALFMAYVASEPLYVSCAFDGTRAYIITVHWYDPNVWLDPWTRKV
jgi:Domain of unknown function (DUF4258)